MLLPLHQILPFPQPLRKDNNPLPRTMFLPPLSKVRCCHPKKFGRLPEGLLPIRTINEIFRTISRKVPTPLPINERSVGFVFALSHPLFVGEELAPPVAPNLSIPATIAKGQHPLSPYQHSCLLMNVPFVLHPHYPTHFS